MRVCCICGKSFDSYGYNPVPIESAGVCCRACNDTLVIPRRLRDYKIERIQQDADALRTERGVLHIDTLATRLHSADAAHIDNTRVIGYCLDRGKHRQTRFKKTHVVNIALDNIAPPLPAIYLCNGENTHCSKTNCVYSGGGCKYTTNIDYAVNPVKRTPSIITAADTDDDVVYYDDEKCAVDRTEV